MSQVASYSKSGAKSAAKVSLDKKVFGVEVKSHGLLKSAYHAYLDNGRGNLAKTKTRGEVVGSTKKPWKQKGTGRARFGSRYNPIWRGGGIIFGPTSEENYSKKLNKKAKKVAVCQALTLAVKSGALAVIDDFVVSDGKTKSAQKLLDKIGAKRRTLVVAVNPNEATNRAVNNIQDVKLVNASYLNTYDVLNADLLVITKSALDEISTWLVNPAKTIKSTKESTK
ncbi:MAG TPA: 50S ribosomal protein L4 [Candidatus Saccharimonadales bacterium]|nr:50S ribosomal protein L4 [Candidatus Saccharimonadales bacterium]